MNRKYYIGIDLGTSSCKGILVDRTGTVLRQHSVAYPVLSPHEGWSEQNPEDWLKATKTVLNELSAGVQGEVFGLSFGGQMHGLVALDRDDRVIRPAILWNDGRTGQETSYLNTVVGRERLSKLTGNIAFAGFTAPKLLWLREHEPESFARIAKICLPKDYLAYRLTGAFTTDCSDASGTLLFDVGNRCWSKEMCAICGVDSAWLPRVCESYEVTGKVLPEFGLPSCIVTAGAGDNAAAAIGTGTIPNGSCNISLGTSGTVFLAENACSVDPGNALHSFAHANGKWHLMGCILSAASCRRWWLGEILGSSDYQADEESVIDAGDHRLIFVPYLSGERSPHNDVNVRGAFIGLSSTTTRAQMSRAVMEGVAFALRDCLEVARAQGICPASTTLCGGGAKSRVWRQIIADILKLPVHILSTEEGPALGAAILAMVGAREYPDVDSAAAQIVTVSDTVLPQPVNMARYEKMYEVFRRMYPFLSSIAEG